MEDIYKIEISNNFQSLLINKEEDSEIATSLNRESLHATWNPISLHFESLGSKNLSCPDVTFIAGFPGVIAIPALQKKFLFPSENSMLEFLPIVVSNTDRLLVNCLKSTAGYDGSRSKFLRDINRGFSALSEEDFLKNLRSQIGNPLDILQASEKGDGEIFSIESLVMVEKTLKTCQLFTLSDSNRATVFAMPVVANRFHMLNLKGLFFRKVGFLEN